MNRDEMREYLGSIYDMERLMTRISMRTANPRGLLSFKTSLHYLPDIKNLFKEFSGRIFDEMYQKMDTLQDIYELIDQAIVEEPPLAIKESGIIKEGFDADIDHFREAGTNGKTWRAEMGEREKEKTGIKNLRIKYSNVFG